MIQFQEKTNDTIPDRQKDRRTEGQKDRQTLFHKTLPANTRGPKNKKLIKINKQKNKNKKQINKQKLKQAINCGTINMCLTHVTSASTFSLTTADS